MDRTEELQNKYKLDESVNQSIFDRIIVPRFFDYSEPSVDPHCIILGGQPGAGKSQLEIMAISEFDNNARAVVVSADNYRFLHPDFTEIATLYPDIAAHIVNPDASAWTAKLIKLAQEGKRNVVLESTMRDANLVNKTINKFKEHHYKVDLKLLSINPNVSRLNLYLRYEQMVKDGRDRRFVSVQDHDSRYNPLANAIKEILKQEAFNEFKTYGRSVRFSKGKYIEQTTLINTKAQDTLTVHAKEVTRTLSEEELLLYTRRSEDILKMMNGRGADKEYIIGYIRNVQQPILDMEQQMKLGNKLKR